MLETFLSAIEHSRVALTVRDSQWLTASLSSLHLFGVTLIGGAALVSGLRLTGRAFVDEAAATVVRPAGGFMLVGVAISIATGALLVAPRAGTASTSGFFQLKMACLIAAVIVQALLQRRVAAAGGRSIRTLGILGSALCFAVIASGCAYILLE